MDIGAFRNILGFLITFLITFSATHSVCAESSCASHTFMFTETDNVLLGNYEQKYECVF